MKFKTIFSSILFPMLILLFGCSDFSNNNSKKGTPAPPTDLGDNPFKPGFDPNEGEFTEAKMLANMGLNVIQPKVKDFRLQSEMLYSKVSKYCQVLEQGGPGVAELDDSQRYWKDAMMAFHLVDSSPIGPQVSYGGGIIGDNLYKWPMLNVCGVDLEVEKQARLGTRNPQLIFTVRGLGALEYLLYENTLGSSCDLNRPSYGKLRDWVAKEDKIKKQDRCQYALYVTQDLVEKAQLLEQQWDEKKGNYSKSLYEGTAFESMKKAVNEMSNAMFVIEFTKDDRLAVPLGLNSKCTDAAGKCVQKAEHIWSGQAFEAIGTRIRGLQQIFWGANTPNAVGYGFDDYLRTSGHADVADHVTQVTNAALESLAQIKTQGSLQEQIEKMDVGLCREQNTSVPVCKFYQDVRQISNVLKTEFLVALSLSAPPVHQGDND